MGDTITCGAKVTELFGVDVSGIDPATSIALTQAVLAREAAVVETGRRVVITWKDGGRSNWLAIHDADTGELIPVYAMHLYGGSAAGWDLEAPLLVELTELVADDGTPLREAGPPVSMPEYQAHLVKVAERRGGRKISELTDGEAAELDALQASFVGAKEVTTIRRYEVAGMRVAD
jgi:hypothetical protein